MFRLWFSVSSWAPALFFFLIFIFVLHAYVESHFSPSKLPPLSPSTVNCLRLLRLALSLLTPLHQTFFYFIYLYIKAKQALSVLSLFMMARSAAQLRELSQRTLERNNRCFFSQSCCTSLDRCAPVLPLSHEGRCVVLSWGAVEERTLLCGRIMCPCQLTKRWCFTAAVSFDSVPILCNKPQLKWLMELNRYLMTKTKFKLLFGTQEETFQDSDTVRLS